MLVNRVLIWLCIFVFASCAVGADLTQQDAVTLDKAQTAYNAKQYQEAAKLLLPLQQKYPTVGEIPRLLTHVYHELGEFGKARQTALTAIGMGRMTPDVLVRLAQIDRQRDDRLALISTVRLLTIVDAGNRDWRSLYGDLLAGAKSFQESAAVYRALIEQKPDSIDYHLRLGNVLSLADEPNEAVNVLETAWRLGSRLPNLPRTIASLWQQLGDERQAIAWTERALALNAVQDDLLTLNFAQLCWQQKEFIRAAKAVKPLTNSPQLAIKGKAHALLGQIAMDLKQTDSAVAQLQMAVDAGFESPQLLAVIGAHYYNQGDFKRAAAMLQKVVVDESSDEKHLRFLVISLIRSKEKEQAREYLSQYVERHGLDDNAKQLVRLLVSPK